MPELQPASIVVSHGRPEPAPGAPVSPGIMTTSTYIAGGDHLYARSGNATWTAFETAVGALEGGTAQVFASGMGAIDAAFSLAAEGSGVLIPETAYNATLALSADLAATGRRHVTRVDITDTARAVAALADQRPAMLWLESPTNPLLGVADLARLSDAAHQHGALVVVDNTFATPLTQRPLDLGADVVVHSATKYLSGHSDVILGVTVTRDAGLADRLVEHRTTRGAIAGPFETWLALRGLRTLSVRFERACTNAATVADRLRKHPAVDVVRYPGFGAMVAIDVHGDAAAADRVCAATRLWTHATSLGGVESLLERRRHHANESDAVPDNLIRLSVGIEDVEDLWRDLTQALDAV